MFSQLVSPATFFPIDFNGTIAENIHAMSGLRYYVNIVRARENEVPSHTNHEH